MPALSTRPAALLRYAGWKTAPGATQMTAPAGKLLRPPVNVPAAISTTSVAVTLSGAELLVEIVTVGLAHSPRHYRPIPPKGGKSLKLNEDGPQYSVEASQDEIGPIGEILPEPGEDLSLGAFASLQPHGRDCSDAKGSAVETQVHSHGSASVRRCTMT